MQHNAYKTLYIHNLFPGQEKSNISTRNFFHSTFLLAPTEIFYEALRFQ